jgi:ATP adenylyltransferase
MTMDKLWAPWRVTYIAQILKKKKGCVFCTMFRQKTDRKNYVLTRSKHSYAVLNIYPYNNGHMLIVANRHVGDFEKLSREERMDMFDLLLSTKSLLQRALKPHGYNVGVNLGRVAGAGFPGHLHMHVVPRWKGDVNFMPVTAHAKILSQSLEALYRELSRAHKRRL